MRRDIQFLRGVAVLLVVASHAFQWLLPYGSLGVDVFFVISGFLMTKLIVTEIDAGTFTLRGFYLRRARRLLPASLVTVGVTALLASAFLPVAEWGRFGWSVLGALTFTANITAQAQLFQNHLLQPLSHFWSLSLEEQFYLFFPALLLITPKQFRLAGLVTVAAYSFAIMLWTDPIYFLPSRGWELLVGGAVYLKRDLPIPAWVKWVALAGVFGAVAFDQLELAVLATGLMLCGKDGWVKALPIERIGDWSYSLYLIHWPLLVFVPLALGPVDPLLTVGASIALAALSYYYVEQPWRLKRPSLLGPIERPKGGDFAAG